MSYRDLMFHPGFVESCHEPRPHGWWYLKQGHPPNYCDAIEKGGYIVCGTSGSQPWCVDSNGEINNRTERVKPPCCCFVTGRDCAGELLKRRWTCCRKEFTGTFYDCLKVQGCEFAYNLTD